MEDPDSSPRKRRDSGSQTDAADARRQRRLSLEEKVTAVAESIVTNTSCLAIGNIFIRKHVVLKTLWCIAFVLCTVLTIRQLYSLSKTYFSYPVSTSIELRYSENDFPTVTVCNLNPLRKSKVKQYGSKALVKFITDLEEKFVFEKDNGTELDTRILDWEKFRVLLNNESVTSRLNMGHSLNDLILQCSFNGTKCNTEKMFTPLLSDSYGNCYTFNSYVNFNKSGEHLSTRDGRSYGLILTLFLEYDEYLTNFVPSSGARLHIHEPTSLEHPDVFGYSIPPGFETSLGITVDRIIRLGPPHGNCTTGDTFEQKYKMKYTLNACRTACRHEYVLKQCKCFDRANLHFYPQNKTVGPCQTATEIKCLLAVTVHMDRDVLACRCQMPCEEYQYKIRQSMSEWPADSYEKRLFGDLSDINPKINELVNKSTNLARRNLVNIIIYQEDTYYNEIRQKAAYEWDSFLSDIGGTLNLFLGFSALTGFEFLEALCLLLTYTTGRFIYRNDEDDEDKEEAKLVPNKNDNSKLPYTNGR